MLPIKLKTEVWTVYANDFERVEQLRPVNVRGSSRKKKKSKKQAKATTGLQDWHMGDAVTGEIVKLQARPSLSLSQAQQIHHLASQARKVADEQLQNSIAEGFTPEQVRQDD